MGAATKLYVVFTALVMMGWFNWILLDFYGTKYYKKAIFWTRQEQPSEIKEETHGLLEKREMLIFDETNSAFQLVDTVQKTESTHQTLNTMKAETNNTKSDIINDRHESQGTKNATKKKILVFNVRSKSQQQSGNFMQAWDEKRAFSKCYSSNCLITMNRSYYGSESLGHFDAVLFQGMATHDPLSEYTSSHARQRRQDQIFIFYTHEAPTHLLKKNHSFCKEFFNATMTYRQDSDIYSPYGSIIPRSKDSAQIFKNTAGLNYDWVHTYHTFDMQYFDNNLKTMPKNLTDLAYRPKKIAWFVSKCKTFSHREDYVKELQKYIQVDIYGKCGTLTCFKGEHCDEMLKRDYKFYLAFENSLCEDYVTEKFFARAIQTQLLPIVMGGANYSQFVPQHSHLNVNDFESPQALAEYIEFLDKNPLEYLSYFWWRPMYHVMYHRPLCLLCDFLNRPVPPRKTVDDLRKSLFEVDGKEACETGPFSWSHRNV